MKQQFEAISKLETFEFQDLAPMCIHVHIDNVGRFLETDEFYRNQFETGTSCGALDDGNVIRKGWETELFGGCYDEAKPFERCKYGALSVLGQRTIGVCDVFLK